MPGTKVSKQSKERKKTTNLHEVNNPNFYTVKNKQVFYTIAYFYAPAIYNGGGHIASPLSVRPYIRTSRTSCPVRTKNGFRAISFEYIGVLDSYFIQRYIIIKYRSSLITDKIYRLLSELWTLISERKMVSGRYLLNTLVNWIYISYKGI